MYVRTKNLKRNSKRNFYAFSSIIYLFSPIFWLFNLYKMYRKSLFVFHVLFHVHMQRVRVKKKRTSAYKGKKGFNFHDSMRTYYLNDALRRYEIRLKEWSSTYLFIFGISSQINDQLLIKTGTQNKARIISLSKIRETLKAK